MIFINLKSLKTIKSGIKFLSHLTLIYLFLAGCSVPNALKPKKISKPDFGTLYLRALKKDPT